MSCFLGDGDICLKPLTKEDIENGYYLWFQDSDVNKYTSHGIFPSNEVDSLNRYLSSLESKSELVFLAYDINSDDCFGVCSLQSIDWVVRSAELARTIGVKKYRGYGYGTKMVKILLDYAFDSLNINRVWAGNDIDNIAAIKSLEKCGFKREGVLRETVYRNGKYHDSVISSVLRRDYYG